MISEKLSNRHVMEARKRPSIGSALTQLLEANGLARALDRPAQEFCVRLSSLILGGSSAPAVQWLQNGGYVRQIHDRSKSRHAAVASKNGAVDDHSRFVLTVGGLRLARLVQGRRAAVERKTRIRCNRSVHKPHWDSKQRELWLGDQLVKRFAVHATNQCLLMAVFQEEDWPVLVLDPFPGGTHRVKRKRLNNVIERLNKGHAVSLIRFHSNGNGDGVWWEIVGKKR